MSHLNTTISLLLLSPLSIAADAADPIRSDPILAHRTAATTWGAMLAACTRAFTSRGAAT